MEQEVVPEVTSDGYASKTHLLASSTQRQDDMIEQTAIGALEHGFNVLVITLNEENENAEFSKSHRQIVQR